MVIKTIYGDNNPYMGYSCNEQLHRDQGVLDDQIAFRVRVYITPELIAKMHQISLTKYDYIDLRDTIFLRRTHEKLLLPNINLDLLV